MDTKDDITLVSSCGDIAETAPLLIPCFSLISVRSHESHCEILVM